MPHLVSGINSLVLSVNLIPLPLRLACSCSYHIFSVCQLTTLTIHNSRSLSLPPEDLPLSQIFPTIDFLQASGLAPRTLWLDHFFWACWVVVFSLLLLFFWVLCGRLSWLFVSYCVHINIVYRIIGHNVERCVWCLKSLCNVEQCPICVVSIAR